MREDGATIEPAASHPLDVVERIVDGNEWSFERRNDQEMTVQAPGRWCDYSLYFAWNDEVGAMHFTCAFDMGVPDSKRAQVNELLSLANGKLWLGHFSVWDEGGLPMFCHAMPLRGTRGPTIEQMEDLMDIAISECDRFYPAFQHVIWGGGTAADAVAAAIIETMGEA
jgi:hypothetical protein